MAVFKSSNVRSGLIAYGPKGKGASFLLVLEKNNSNSDAMIWIMSPHMKQSLRPRNAVFFHLLMFLSIYIKM